MKKKYFLLFLSFSFYYFGISQEQVTGTVTDLNGDALIGATILEAGTTNGAISDVNGQFLLTVSNLPATLQVSYLGYSTKSVEVNSNDSSLQITLESGSSQLEEVVITGLASSVKRSNLANTVATVSAEELTGRTVQSTLDGALNGKVAGAEVRSLSGAPGGGFSVKMRGITSISSNSQPLYIVDGVYYDNSASSSNVNAISEAAGQGSNSNQDNPSNRIADLDPADIASVEILKGASAAAIYGSRAAGGVILITTKRGGSGKARIRISESLGVNWQLRKLGVRNWTDETVFDTYDQSELEEFQKATREGNIYNYEDELYGETGVLSTARLSISGGNGQTDYFVGGTVQDDQGIVDRTGYEKNSIRLNLDQKVTDKIDISVSTNYVNSSADRGFFGNDNTGTSMGVSFVNTPTWMNLYPNESGIYPNNRFAGSNFLQTRDLITNNESVERILLGISGTAELYSNKNNFLKLVGRLGIDRYTLQTNAQFPSILQFMSDGAGVEGGASIVGNNISKNMNANAFLVHDYFFGNNSSLTTQVGVTNERIDFNKVVNTATFVVAGQTNLDQAGSRETTQDRILQTDKGFFVQSEYNFEDKYIVTGGLRGDKSSRNGDANDLSYYPKASLAVNLHELGLLDNSTTFDRLKLRAAYGQTGNFAPFGALYTPLLPVVIDGTVGSLIGTTRGDSNIKPERQKEFETGFDLGLLVDKVSLEFTYYNKNVDDLILPVDYPSSSGFSGFFINGAGIRNQGIEIGLDLNPLNKTSPIKWNSFFSFWRNRSEVTRLDVPAYNTGGFGATLGTYRIEEGKPATQLVGIGPDNLDSDGDGLVIWGDTEPDFNLSWTNTFDYKRLSLSFLWHWKNGGDGINLTTLLSDLAGTTPDFDDTDLDPNGEMKNGDFRTSQLGSSADPFIQDASYLRLRELSLNYRPTIKLSKQNETQLRLGLSAKNLVNVFDYFSYDPEVSNFGASAISTAVEVTPFPTAKSAYFNIGLEF